jgi:hypothetical protein
MTIAKQRITAIRTSAKRLLAQLRDATELEVRTDEAQSVRCVDPGPCGFDFSDDEVKRVLQGEILP